MSEQEAAIKRYQNEPGFHALVETMVQLLDHGMVDRYGIMDALHVAELVKHQRDLEQAASRTRNGAGK